MSTTFTYFQLEELNEKKKPTTIHRRVLSTKELQTVPDTPHHEEQAHLRQPLEAKQRVLLLKGIREQYTLVNDHDIPSICHPGEILVKECSDSARRLRVLITSLQVLAIGLNPIDWKAPYATSGRFFLQLYFLTRTILQGIQLRRPQSTLDLWSRSGRAGVASPQRPLASPRRRHCPRPINRLSGHS